MVLRLATVVHFRSIMARVLPTLQFFAAIAAACSLAAGCGSTAETSVAIPTAPTRCQATLGIPSTNFTSAGGTGSVAVSVARECTWSAASAAPWITVTAGQEGQGEGTVTFRIGENVDPSVRRGSLNVAQQAVQLAQEAAPCRYTVGAAETSAPATGGDLSIDIRTHALCSWSVASSADWMSVSPNSGRGDATVHVSVVANTSTTPRSAPVTVAGQSVTLSQAPRATPPPAPAPPAPAPPTPAPPTPAPPAPTPPPPTPPPPTPPPVQCTFQLVSASLSVPAEGISGSVRIRTTSVCSWTATSSAGWVVVNTPSGSGEADVRFTVAENFSPASRSATLTIGGQRFQITQAAAPEIRLDGKISAISGSCPTLTFTVENQVVRTDSQTEFNHGRCSDVRNDRKVNVRGYMQPDGKVLLHRVDF